jgi:hypothetical protein
MRYPQDKLETCQCRKALCRITSISGGSAVEPLPPLTAIATEWWYWHLISVVGVLICTTPSLTYPLELSEGLCLSLGGALSKPTNTHSRYPRAGQSGALIVPGSIGSAASANHTYVFHRVS